MIESLLRHLNIVLYLCKFIHLITGLLKTVLLPSCLVLYNRSVESPPFINYLHHVTNLNFPVFGDFAFAELAVTLDKVLTLNQVPFHIRKSHSRFWDLMEHPGGIENGFQLFLDLLARNGLCLGLEEFVERAFLKIF